MIWGFDEDHRKKMIQAHQMSDPFFHIDHAYVKRGYENGNFRVNFKHFHQTGLLDVPGDRVSMAKKRIQDWNRTGRNVVVIIPSETVLSVIHAWRGGPATVRDWTRQTEETLRKHTDRPIVMKKKGPGLDGFLREAWAVVSLSSVSEVEAALKGIPVFTSPDSPASPVSLKDLSLIEQPIYPDREAWLRSLGYSQFNVSEMKNGKVASILKDIYGLL